MANNTKLWFYSLDISGIKPQFRILNNDSYKSIPSTIISVIIIVSSITFSIYSIIEYIEINNPSIFYLQKYDNISNKTLLLKDTLFMFDVEGLCFDDYSLDIDLDLIYISEYENTKLIVEKCQIGKNINIKFKDILENKDYASTIEEFLCISSEQQNFPLSYEPGKDEETSIEINAIKKRNCSFGVVYIDLITEKDILQHEKKNPINISLYRYNDIFEYHQNNLYPSINYRFEIQRYESDDGYFFQNSKNYIAIEMSEISYKNYYNTNFLARISFGQSNKYYTYFKRRFQKIQSLLADIMSVINILIQIGKIISNFLLKKKMNKDIVRSLINRNIYTKECSLIEKNKKEKQIFKNINEKSINLERKEINIKEKSNIKDNYNNLFNIKLNNSKNDIFNEKKLEKIVHNTKIHIFKQMNFLDIIKSYFCLKEKKIKLINICNDLIMKDLCIENILGRLNELEKLFSLISKKKLSKLNLHINKKFKTIYKYLKEINKESMKKMNNKNIKNIDLDKSKNVNNLKK